MRYKETFLRQISFLVNPDPPRAEMSQCFFFGIFLKEGSFIKVWRGGYAISMTQPTLNGIIYGLVVDNTMVGFEPINHEHYLTTK